MHEEGSLFFGHSVGFSTVPSFCDHESETRRIYVLCTVLRVSAPRWYAFRPAYPTLAARLKTVHFNSCRSVSTVCCLARTESASGPNLSIQNCIRRMFSSRKISTTSARVSKCAATRRRKRVDCQAHIPKQASEQHKNWIDIFHGANLNFMDA